jgi:CelD/BcsL family acetyltransferase involved in cellulose biosynthesis
MDVKLKRAKDLTAADLAAWARLRDSAPVYASPFFDPEFTLAVARARDDVFVAVISDGGRVTGVWPHHRRPLGFIRPIAAPLSDWQGPILAADARIDLAEVLAEMGAGATRLTGAADPHLAMAKATIASAVAYVADLRQGAESYFQWQETTWGHHFKNLRRRERKAEREIGALNYCIEEENVEVFDQLLAWKRGQYAATGKHDVLGPDWVDRLMRELWARKGESLRLTVTSLRLGQRLAAAEIFLRGGRVKHSWFPAYDRELHSYGPGHMLTDAAIRRAGERGYDFIEFGAGHDEYKRTWGNLTVPIHEIVAHGAGPMGMARRAGLALWMGLEAAPVARIREAAPRLRRRVDQIAAVEASWVKVAQGLRQAVGQGRLSPSRAESER